ncbi:MAG: cytochrome C oxidase Cbb3, partial [Pseudoalteromonas tetraodonis]
QSLEASHPFYVMRFLGGVFIVTGMLVMAYNVYRTVSAKNNSLELDEQAQLA